MSSSRPAIGTDPDRLARVDVLRREAGARGASTGGIPNARLERFLEAVLEQGGDLELAADALTLKPRPAWVVRLLEA